MDLADSHVAALKKMFAADFFGVKIYNLGTGQGNSVLEMVKAFEEASGLTKKFLNFLFCEINFTIFFYLAGKPIPYEIVDRRPGDVSSSYCSSKLAEVELGWKAQYNLIDMCKFFYPHEVLIAIV